MQNISVNLKERSYDIVIKDGILGSIGSVLKKIGLGSDAIIITNDRIKKILGKSVEGNLLSNGFSTLFVIVPDSEKAKSFATAERVLNKIALFDKKRASFIIALGGGVTGDLAGFVASIYKRGIPFVQCPTTLLAQVDSAIGGKAAIDLPVAKNMVGSFYQPKIVLSDISVLSSLETRQIRSGLSEIIKYGVISDAELFGFIEMHYGSILSLDSGSLKHVITRSSAIKASFVSRDEYDTRGLRAKLNFGHTIGHAIEAAAGYTARFNHGEAVAAGMVVASRIAERIGILKSNDCNRIERLINLIGLPTRIKDLPFKSIHSAYLHDKKFINKKNRLVLPCRIGYARVVDGVPDNVIRTVLRNHITQ